MAKRIQTHSRNIYVRKTIGNQPHVTYFYYGQKGYGIQSYIYTRKLYYPQVGEKLIWVPKSNNPPKINKTRPKTIWVLISKN